MKLTKTCFYRFLAVCIVVCLIITACRKQEVPTTALHAVAFKANKRLDSLLLAKNKVSKQKVNSMEVCLYSMTFNWSLMYTPGPNDYYNYSTIDETIGPIFQYHLIQDMYAAGATTVFPGYGTRTLQYLGKDLSHDANAIVRQALEETLAQLLLHQANIYECYTQNSNTCYPNPDNNPGAGGPTTNTPAKDPCAAAKDLTDAWNKALASTEVNAQLTALKNMNNTATEHGFIITLDATGYHTTAIITGDATSTTFTVPPNTLFVVHTHPTNTSSMAPSSTDITGLQGFGTGLAGDIIITGNDMTLVSITDPDAYGKFKASHGADVDKTNSSGWRYKSSLWREFDSFSNDFKQMYTDMDATLPAQLQLIKDFNMGVTVQKWYPNTTGGQFYPLVVDIQRNVSTGSGTTMSGDGTVINSRYSSIQVNSKNCN